MAFQENTVNDEFHELNPQNQWVNIPFELRRLVDVDSDMTPQANHFLAYRVNRWVSSGIQQSDVIGLPEVLNDKSNASHTHDERYYTSAQVDGLLTLTAPLVHEHDERYYQQVEVDALLNEKSDVLHDHNIWYYTIEQMDSFLGNKAPQLHTHSVTDVVDLSIDQFSISSLQDVDGDLSGSVGDLFYFNGQNWSVLPKGQALQYLRVNSMGTGLEYTAVGGGGGGIIALIEDVNPALGGNLNLNTFGINSGEITITGGEIEFLDGVTSNIQTQLNGKSNTGHDHDDAYYTKNEVDTALDTKSNSNHNHDDAYYTKNEVDTALGTKSNSNHNHDDAYYTKNEVDTALDTKSNSNHNHDDAYYTKNEVDTALGTKANTNHNHDDAYYTKNEVDTALGTKANTSHNHTRADITGIDTETVYTLTGVAINPSNGTIQVKTLTADVTFTESLSSGQSVLLHLIDADEHEITWPTIKWRFGREPVLMGNDMVVIWKVGSTLYGVHTGSFE